MAQTSSQAAAEAAARAAAEEAARREAERQRRIAELRGQLSSVEGSINHFKSVLRTLTDGKTSLTTYTNTLDTEVLTPVANYSIHGANDWEGTNADNAANALGTVKTKSTSYQSEITQLATDIQNGINKANEKIQSLNNERNNILGQLRALGA
jgi:chromosome segregation ATPase